MRKFLGGVKELFGSMCKYTQLPIHAFSSKLCLLSKINLPVKKVSQLFGNMFSKFWCDVGVCCEACFFFISSPVSADTTKLKKPKKVMLFWWDRDMTVLVAENECCMSPIHRLPSTWRGGKRAPFYSLPPPMKNV